MKNSVPIANHVGGSLMVLYMMTLYEVGPFCCVHDTMQKGQYLGILKNLLIKAAQEHFRGNFIF